MEMICGEDLRVGDLVTVKGVRYLVGGDERWVNPTGRTVAYWMHVTGPDDSVAESPSFVRVPFDERFAVEGRGFTIQPRD